MRSVFILASTAILLCGIGACDENETRTPGAQFQNGILVLHSDATYSNSLLSTLEASSGRIFRNPCLSSANQSPLLSSPVSGDLALTSQTILGDQEIILDRTYGTLIWLNPYTCQVVLQAPISPKWQSNPHDAVLSNDLKLFVSRYTTNPAPTEDPADLDEGGDLYVEDFTVDASKRRLPRRIDLAPFASATESGVLTDPRPDRMYLSEGRLYVTLNNFTRAFDGAGYARIAVIDVASERVVDVIDLPELKNCSALSPVLSNPRWFATACNGAFTDADQMAHSGIALIDPTRPIPVVTIVPASAFGASVSNSDLVVLDPQHAFTVVAGTFDKSRADALWSFDFQGGTPRTVHTGTSAFALAGLAYYAPSKRLYLADADPAQPGVLPFSLENVNAPTLLARVPSDPAYGLLPRAILVY